MSRSGKDWPGRMYLDTDVILALVKDSDWLQSEVDMENIDAPKTSTTALIEAQIVFIGDSREHAAGVKQEVDSRGIQIVSTGPDVVEKSSAMLEKYERLNVFDSLHLSHAEVLDEKIVSTDTLYPEIDEVENVDPRELG